ncbi:MAG: hypothetical protein QNL91_06285 [Candidatus Krumholzibacteria bacterium]|nr:hypothetical protein [Candidatus Krumholzibacteria bacterium]
MSRYSTPRTALTLILMTLALPAMLLATEPENDKDSQKNDSTVVIIGDEGEELTLSLEDGELTVVTSENGKTTTRIMDMEAMGFLAADAVDEALVGMEGVFEELQDMQFQFRMGQDNRLNLSYDDTEFELDMDQVMAQVASAVELGLQEINTAEWTEHRSRWDEVSDDELRDELDNLKDEMEDLRRELRRLQKEEKKR